MLIALLAGVMYIVYAIAWPMHAGRDFGSSLVYFAQMGMNDPGYPQIMLHRTAVAPLIFGTTIKLGGAELLEILIGVFYVLAIVFVYRIGAFFNRQTAVVSALLVVFFPPYALLYHKVSSDTIFAFELVIWFYFAFVAAKTPLPRNYMVCGVILGLMLITRPVAQLFVLFALHPFFLGGVSSRRKIKYSLSFLLPFFAIALGYSTFNWIENDRFKIADGKHMPFKKIMAHYAIGDPDAGPASREVAAIVEKKLLNTELYKKYKVDINDVFTGGSNRISFDVIEAVRESVEDPGILRTAALEAITHNLGAFTRMLLYDFMHLYVMHPDTLLNIGPKERSGRIQSSADFQAAIERRLRDYEPDHYIIPISLYELEMYRDEHRLSRVMESRKRGSSLRTDIPQRRGNSFVAKQVDRLTALYPGWYFALLLILIALYVRRDRLTYTYSFLLILSIGGTLVGILGVNFVWEYRTVFDPIWIIGMTMGIVRGGIAFSPEFGQSKTTQA